MAMSNWDALAFDTNGNPCASEMETKDGLLEIYKNWFSFGKINVEEGNLWVGSTSILAKRGPQNGIFVFVTVYDSSAEEGKKKSIFSGIGCSSCDDNLPRMSEAMGVDLSLSDSWIKGSEYGPDGNFYTLSYYDATKEEGSRYPEFRIEQEGNEHLNSKVVGVMQETYEEYIKWLEAVVSDQSDDQVKEWFDKVKTTAPKRFNQGDTYLGEEEMSEIGDGDTPIALQMIGGKGDE